jgi:hypothetical protein
VGAEGGSTRKPNPLLRGTVVGLGAAVIPALNRYDALSKPHGPKILGTPLTISLIAVFVVGLGAGAAVYWAAAKDRAELDRADDELERADRRRLEVLKVVELLADAQSVLIGAAPERRDEQLGRFKSTTVEGSVRITRALQRGTDVDVRAVLLEYDSSRIPPFTPGAAAGELLPPEITFDQDNDFFRAARRLMEGDLPYYLGDENSMDPDARNLRLPRDVKHYLRIRVISGDHKFGILCIDMWKSQAPNQADITPILAIAKLLGAGLGAASDHG